MYKKIIDAFDIKQGDVIYLSSDVTKLADYFRRNVNERFEPVRLLSLFQEAVGKKGTIMLPVFCFDFSNKGCYDYKNSKGTTGALGNVALFKCGYNRTRHPMHSFAVWGKDSEMLVKLDNRHSFGKDSPFEYCRKNNVKQIMLGTDYRHSMTFIHYVESICNVPYRFAKSFIGDYVDADGRKEERTYDYSARRLDIGSKEKFNRIGKILEEKGIAQMIIIEGLAGYISHMVMLGESFSVIQNDIVKNQCKNIYDFSVSRDELLRSI